MSEVPPCDGCGLPGMGGPMGHEDLRDCICALKVAHSESVQAVQEHYKAKEAVLQKEIDRLRAEVEEHKERALDRWYARNTRD